MKKSPRIMFATIPLRNPSTHIPIASLAILSELERRGYKDLHLFEVNILRPSYEEILKRFEILRPDIIGLSAVVSTSYAFVKKLTDDLKRLLPGAWIICGGNMVASANVILRRTRVDVCCTGEGEDTMCELVRLWEIGAVGPDALRSVKGIAYLDAQQNLVVTPYAEQLTESRIFDVEWSIAEGIEGIDRCFSPDIAEHGLFTTDPRYYEPERRGKNYGRFYASKGCVARCTFCHRFTKGIRYVPIDILEKRLADYIDRFNIGFITFSDENFATHQKWIDPFLEMVSKFDILWAVGGIRVNRINADLLRRMYQSGCTTVAYGTETGSPKMLAIMEKKVDIEDNYAIAEITPEANLFYVPQMVIGMPGETSDTIEDSIKFLEAVYTKDPFIHPSALQVNYAQALPGTPLYEASRMRETDPESIDKEEDYLLKISDKNARDLESTVNHTDTPYLIWKVWGYQMRVAATFAFIKKFGTEEFFLWHKICEIEGRTVVRGKDGRNYYCDTRAVIDSIRTSDEVMPAIMASDVQLRNAARRMKYKSKNRLFSHPVLAYRLRKCFPLYLAARELRTSGLRLTFIRVMEYFRYLILSERAHQNRSISEGVSLRATTKEKTESCSETAMVMLRLGR